MKLAARMLARQPGLTAVAVIALAVGFGTNTAIFTIVSSLLLRPLPYPDADRLVAISGTSRLAFEGQVLSSPAEFVQWRETNHVFASLVASTNENVTLTLPDRAEEVRGAQVSGDLLPMLRARPEVGQPFAAEDFQAGGAMRVLISDRLWRTLFAADPRIVGRPLLLNGQSAAVAGVMPASFQFPSVDTDVWQPLRFTSAQLGVRGRRYLDVYGSLKAGVTPEQAAGHLRDVVRRMERDYPEWLKGRGVEVTPLHEKLSANVRPALLMLLGIVGLVLVIACANVSHLLLARTVQRRREIALRTALGGSPWRIVRQVLAECTVLALAAAALGLLLAPLSLRAMAALLPAEGWDAAMTGGLTAGAGWAGVGGAGIGGGLGGVSVGLAALDWRVLLYTFGIALAAIFMFGLAPALSATKVNLADAFQEGSLQSSDSRRTRFARMLLIVAEVAVTVVVLAGAGLLIRSFVEIQQVRRGYDARNLLTMRIPPPRRADVTPRSRAVFLTSLLDDLHGLPGVRSAAVVTGLPLGGLNASVTINVDGHAPRSVEDMPSANVNTISDGYFETMGTRLLRGRFFAASDTAAALRVAIVNQALVRQYWPTTDPIGRRLGPGRDSLVVVGVVEDLRQESLRSEQAPTLYVPYTQRESLAATPNFLVVRTAGDPTRLAEPVVQSIRRLDSGQVIRDVRGMEQVVARSVTRERALMLLMAVFGAIALTLACAGIYSANQYAVVRRTRELGIRMSLGARRAAVLALVIREGMVPVAIGIALGLGAAMAASRAIATFLFGISPLDPLTFLLVAATAAIVALLALTLPAWRATSINPVVALRRE